MLSLSLALGVSGVVTLPRYPPSPLVWPRGQNFAEGIALLDCSGDEPTIVELGVHILPEQTQWTTNAPRFDFGLIHMKWV